MARWTYLAPLLFLGLLAGAAPNRGGPARALAEHESMPLLDLYRVAYGWGSVAFSCTPASYAGGPELPGYRSMRRKLLARRMRVRDRLVAAYGAEPVEEIERSRDEEEHGIYRTGCDEDASPRGRARYTRLIELLERRTAGLEPKR
jgi:hypothetical protein